MNVLFICNQNKNRSKTAEILFKDKFPTKSAGLYSEKRVSSKDLQWADLVVVMEEEQRHELAKRFSKAYLQKRILNWDIPDTYNFNHPKLVEKLNEKMEETMELLS